MKKMTNFVLGVLGILNELSDHFYVYIGNGLYLTGEGAVEDGKTYVCCYLTNNVDSLGYCHGDVLGDGYPDTDSSLDDILAYETYLRGIAKQIVKEQEQKEQEQEQQVA